MYVKEILTGICSIPFTFLIKGYETQTKAKSLYQKLYVLETQPFSDVSRFLFLVSFEEVLCWLVSC